MWIDVCPANSLCYTTSKIIRLGMPQTKRKFLSYSKVLFTVSRQRAVISIFFVVIVASGFFLSASPAHAANFLVEGATWILLAAARGFLALTIAALRIFMELAAYNGYIDSPVVLVGWYMVRDVANMFFVVALLVIAFGTILGLENYEWKKSLVKLILAAIFINFSRLIIGILIDASHIFTITFLNAVQGTAGGNLINMLQLPKVLSLAKADPTTTGNSDALNIQLLGGGIMAVIFSLIALVAIGSYLVLMAIRVVALWVLIIVSPLAFILSTLPQTKQYATEFWQELSKYLVVAPTMVFFLWLAFATLGNGDIASKMRLQFGETGQADFQSLVGTGGGSGQASVSEITKWENIAAFAIAIAFLMIGLERTQKVGTVGSSFVSGALDFGKKAITYGSGFAAARFAGGMAAKGAVGGLKLAATHFPVVGGKAMGERWRITKGRVAGWYYGKGYDVTPEGEKTRNRLAELHEQKHDMTPEGREELVKHVQRLEEQKKDLEKRVGDESTPETEKNQISAKIALTDKDLAETKARRLASIKSTEEKEEINKEIEEKEKLLKKQMGGGPLGAIARKGMAIEKQAEKIEKQAKTRRDLLRKRTSSDSIRGLTGMIGLDIGMGTEGIFGGRFADRYGKKLAQDRVEEGWLQGEDLRSRAKDLDIQTGGRLAVLQAPRLKSSADKGLLYEFEKGSLMDQIQDHKMRGEIYESRIHHLETEAKEKMLERSEKLLKDIGNMPGLKDLKDRFEKSNKELGRLTTVLRDLKNLEAAKKRLDDDPGDEKLKTNLVSLVTDFKTNHGDMEGKNFDETKIGVTIENVKKTLGSGTEERVKVGKEYTEAFEHELEGLAKKGMGQDILAWELSKQKAEIEHSELFYKGREKKMIDDAAQIHIWNDKGIVTPNNANLAIIEALGKDFKAMNYEAAVAAIENHMQAVQEKRDEAKRAGKEFEVDFEDFAIGVALMQKLEEGKWIDDGIKPFRKVASKFYKQFGDQGAAAVAAGSGGRGSGGESGGRIRASQGLGDVLTKMLGNETRALVDAILQSGSVGREAAIDKLKAALIKNQAEVEKIQPLELKGAGLSSTGGVPSDTIEELATKLSRMDKEELEKLFQQYLS